MWSIFSAPSWSISDADGDVRAPVSYNCEEPIILAGDADAGTETLKKNKYLQNIASCEAEHHD